MAKETWSLRVAEEKCGGLTRSPDPIIVKLFLVYLGVKVFATSAISHLEKITSACSSGLCGPTDIEIGPLRTTTCEGGTFKGAAGNRFRMFRVMDWLDGPDAIDRAN